MRRTPLFLAVVGALTLAACADDEPDSAATPPPSPTITATSPAATPSPADDVAGMAFAPCEADRFTIAYPADWHTNDPTEAVGACRIFDPGPIEFEEGTDEGIDFAISTFIDPVTYERARDSELPGTLLDERQLTVDGHDAIVREVRSDGQALLPEGAVVTTYIVDLDGEIFVATTSTVGDDDYDLATQILERMVTGELTFTTG